MFDVRLQKIGILQNDLNLHDDKILRMGRAVVYASFNLFIEVRIIMDGYHIILINRVRDFELLYSIRFLVCLVETFS